jgi:hypothetical protein
MAKKPQKPARKTKARTATPKAAAASKLLDLDPDRLPLTERRAKYLAETAGVELEAIAGKTLAEVHERLRWRIDPSLLFFRRICGQVVKRDPVSGALLPVPNATVHVEDTDCSFLGYFPTLSPYVWLYPFGCRREEIAAVRTDACGRFCVYLPWWDIDRILRWRRLRICLWEFFRPRFRDILEPRIPEPRVIPLPGPRPLPDPLRTRSIPADAIERLRDVAGDGPVRRLEAASELALQGERMAALDELLDEPLFAAPTPPPLPEGLPTRKAGRELEAGALGLDPRIGIEKLDFRAFVGPFLRCWDVWLPVWQTVLDVPDITFRVTQDYDNDGVEEVIYSESFFDVRWNSGPIPDVTLEASGLAVATQNCGPVIDIPCGNVASIETAGYLDLEPGYHDDADGYGLRVNRPTATGDYPPPPNDGSASVVLANAPYAGNLNLHGCVRIGNATHYRLRFEYRASAADPWGAPTTFLGIVWTAPRMGPGAPIPFVPDGDGWYEILAAGILVHPNWLLPFYTPARPDGLYRLELQLGHQTGSGINPMGPPSAKRIFRVDNQAPAASFVEVRWRLATAIGPWNDLNSTVVLPAPLNTCPAIHRPTGQDIHLRVVWTAAATHLRDATLVQSGCGGGGLVMLDAGGVEAYRHWHTGPLDNNISQTNHYLLPASRPPGCYTLGIHAWSRAFNPQDFDAASTHDWWVNQGFLWSWPSRAISVVNV